MTWLKTENGDKCPECDEVLKINAEKDMLVPCQGLIIRNECEHRGLLIHKRNGHYSVNCRFVKEGQQ